MRNLKYILSATILSMVLSCCKEKQKVYHKVYINTQADFDQYKNSEFPPGTLILFASGKSFNGQFAPTGSGTKENPIKITAYDPESNEAY